MKKERNDLHFMEALRILRKALYSRLKDAEIKWNRTVQDICKAVDYSVDFKHSFKSWKKVTSFKTEDKNER